MRETSGMRPRLLLLAALTALSSLAFLAAAPAADPGQAAAVAELKKQADAWDQAIVRKDRVAIEANMADEFRQIDGDGDVVAKAEFVQELVSEKLTIHPYTVEDFEVRLFGDTALLYGRTKMTGQFNGKPFTSHYRYIDVYVRREGKWRIVSVQITRLKG